MNPEIFKGILLTPGDMISLTLKGVGTPQFIETAVIKISPDGSSISVVETPILKRLKPNYILLSKDVDKLVITEPAQEAVWRGTRKRLHKDQKVTVEVDGKWIKCVLQAAYDGIAVARTKTGNYISAGACYFEPV